jgi:Rod binding domain-containing protein
MCVDMNISPIPSTSDAADVPIEELAGNKHLTQQQKIHEASRQFEVIMLQQVLSEMQKPVITSEFTDNSTASDIYQGFISQALAEGMSKSGAFGFAKIFEQQLSPHAPKPGHEVSTRPNESVSTHNTISALAPSP